MFISSLSVHNSGEILTLVFSFSPSGIPFDFWKFEPKIKRLLGFLTCSRFVWANGRAAGIGRTIPVRLIGRLSLLEALLSLPLDIWKSQQSFRNKRAMMALYRSTG